MRRLASPGWHLAILALLLALEGRICLLFHPPTAALLLAWCLALGLAGNALADAPAFRKLSPLHQLRATWVLPLVHMACAAGGLALLLTGVARFGPADPWTRATGLPVAWVGRLVLTVFLLVPCSGALLWGRLAGRYLEARRAEPGPAPRDPWLPKVALGMGVVLVGLVSTLVRAPSGRFAHLRAWTQQKLGDPREAQRTLAAARAATPGDPLSDSLLYRLAKIYDEDLSEPGHALPLYLELVELHPRSPWADDADLAAARILRRGERLDEAMARLRAFPDRHPTSALRGEAGWLACQVLDRLAPGRETVACLEALRSRREVVIRPERYPFPIVRVATLAREALEARPPVPSASGR